MNNQELTAKVHSAMYAQCRKRGYAAPVDVLKPSFCYYKRWGVKKKGGQGHKPVIPLRFSKTGAPEIERAYATHFVDSRQIAKLKEQQKEAATANDSSPVE